MNIININYKEKYKKALERASKLRVQNPFDTVSQMMEHVFPELQESEGEKIKKEIISALKWANHKGVYDKHIAWLEKISEQSHNDKAEPKFKIGDWCIDNEDDTIFQIVKVLDNTYTYKTNEGSVYSCTHYSLENDARLWTIEDARIGDVLFCNENVKYSNGVKYERLYLFNNLDNAFFTLTKTSDGAENYAFNVNIDYPDNTVPATKEQRDTLFKVMHEVGYMWDTKNKELKDCL